MAAAPPGAQGGGLDEGHPRRRPHGLLQGPRGGHRRGGAEAGRAARGAEQHDHVSRRPRRQITGRAIAITGGARGIGAAIAGALASRGARVAIGDLDGDRAQATAANLGANAIGVALDVTDTASFAEFLERAEQAHGPLDVLVNNAGIMWVGPFADEPEATALAQFDVNLHGTLRGMKLAIATM